MAAVSEVTNINSRTGEVDNDAKRAAFSRCFTALYATALYVKAMEHARANGNSNNLPAAFCDFMESLHLVAPSSAQLLQDLDVLSTRLGCRIMAVPAAQKGPAN